MEKTVDEPEAMIATILLATGKCHVLRHTFCSRLAMRGVAVKVIQTLAGHANIETTERYLHSDRVQEREAMRLLGVVAA
jgi:site-specific recombinase XerD